MLLKPKIRKKTIWDFLSILIYKLVLDVSYYLVISPVFSYAKLELDFNNIKFIESYLLLFIIFFLMPKSEKKVSNIMIWSLILISYIPMLTIFAFKDESRIFMYAVTAFWMMVFWLSYMPTISLQSLKQAQIIRSFLFIFLTTTAFLMIYKYLGISFNLDLTKVYDIRANYVEIGIPLSGYIFNWVGAIINPVFFAIYITRKKWIYAALIFALQFLLFSSTGHKTYLFALIFVTVLMWIVTRKNPLIYMANGLTGIILLGMLSFWLIKDVWISALFTYRTLLVPGQLYFIYYDFFSQHEYVYLSYSIFQSFLDYPYHLGPTNLIGEVYFNNAKMSANTGIVGDAYMNFGFVGLILFAVLLVIILKLIDACAAKKDIKIAVAAIAMPIITLTNGGLLTNLLTNGLLLSLLLLYLLPKKIITTE